MALTATFWQRGEALDYTNDTEDIIYHNEIIQLASRIGVAGCTILPGKVGSVHVTGVYEIAKADASEEIEMGADVYYSDDGITAQSGSGGGNGDEGGSSASSAVGYAAKASANGDETVYVKIG